MRYDVVANTRDYANVKIIIERIRNSAKCAQMLRNVPQEISILSNAFFKIKYAIQDIFPEVCRKELVLYLFDRAEGRRLHSNGMCIPVNGFYCAIGINEAILLYEERLIYSLLHEITHLRFPEHTERFYGTLDMLTGFYNQRTGEHIEDKWENREKRKEEWINGSTKG